MLRRGIWQPTSFGKLFSLCKTFVFDDINLAGKAVCVVIVLHVSASTSLMIAKQHDC